jgi:DNA repair protein RecN (Recombination protein N)
MLTHLQIRDFAIVDAVEVELGAGFTALTGETGAGKSILVDALLLAVGARSDSGSVRQGAERAEVAASFDLVRNAAAAGWLAEQAIEHEGEVHLRRVVGSDGRSRAYVNGQGVPVQSLRAIGEHLLDVHGQLEYQSLSRRDYQRELLDGAGGLGAQVEAVREAYRGWRALDDALRESELLAGERRSRLDLLSHYVNELDAIDPKPGEVEVLVDERRRIASLGRLAEGARQLDVLLASDDPGAAAALARAQSVVRQLASIDPALAPTAALIREAQADVTRYAEGLEADPARQEFVEARLAALEAAARKHRVDVTDLPGHRQSLARELGDLTESVAGAGDLALRAAAAAAAYEDAARTLSRGRGNAARKLDERVTALMQDLGMRGGAFEARVEAADPPARSACGADEVEFLVSTNPGQALRPLAKTASGGELSRISLALHVATLAATHRPCLVFDEVDAGVGGAVAEMVGRQLRELATSGQVLCVTHLPQVASQADHQLRVVKRSRGGATRTALETLDVEARVEELARMLGGTDVTARAREHAREMLGLARRAAPGVSASGRAPGSSRARSGRGA